MNLIKEIRTLTAHQKRLREFGLVVGGILLVIGAFLAWSNGFSVTLGTIFVVGALLMMFGFLLPRALFFPYRMWITLALVLSLIASPLILGLLFFILMAPLGILQRLFGKDSLARRFDADASTYWISKTPRSSEHMKRPF